MQLIILHNEIAKIKNWRDYETQMTLFDELMIGEQISAGDDPEAYMKFQKTLYNELPGYRKLVELRNQQFMQARDYLAK